MKVRVTERQYKILAENITYTPEKIDEFVNLAHKDLVAAQEVFRQNLRIIASITLFEMADKKAKYEQKYKEITQYANGLVKKHAQYYNVVDMYEVGELPPNVVKLDSLTGEIDNLAYDFGKIGDILQSLMDNTDGLVNFLKPSSGI